MLREQAVPLTLLAAQAATSNKRYDVCGEPEQKLKPAEWNEVL